MSVESIALVLKHSRSKGAARLVMLAIANHDGDGGAWPKMETIAGHANISERHAQRMIRDLVDLGELRVHENAGGTHRTPEHMRTNLYEILVDPTPEPVDNPTEGVTTLSPLPGDDVVTPPVTPSSGGGVTPVSPPGVTPLSPEPSVEPPIEETTRPVGRSAGAPLGDYADGVAALRRRWLATPGLANLMFTLTTEQLIRVERLVNLHGIDRLIAAAVATQSNQRSVRGFLHHWSDLEPSRDRPAESSEPVCVVCSRSWTSCRAADVKARPEDRHEFEAAA